MYYISVGTPMYVCVCVGVCVAPQAEAVTHFAPLFQCLILFCPLLPEVARGARRTCQLCLPSALVLMPSLLSICCCCCYSLLAHNCTRLPQVLWHRLPSSSLSVWAMLGNALSSFSICILSISSMPDLQLVINVIRVNACSKLHSAYPTPPLSGIIKASGLVPLTIANRICLNRV